MTIVVKRIRQGKESTLSECYIDGRFICYGLEDSIREVKIKGSTAIPAGRYRLKLNTYGGMNARYKKRYPTLHRGMIEISDIPNFSYVYIHIGNNIGDTSGCLLVGDHYKKDEDGDYVLEKSAKAYKRVYGLLLDAVAKGEAWIVIGDQEFVTRNY
ncbi:hypothetical protein FAZ19_03910 [Sphingobacterium alkalisoli]|uniref:DUF5675 domain-containing protein n=1 Tax=Sphingobacterium alkalisoli TaxID=1874115 RepID=A0A4V5LZ03_9SPHI|nr:DUF5675 family protein [Sphingobacterium alkalisoli]TJY68409.1 hypothetical protein FAZ19_03910 [Sphingobacterium alkalisoli]GGH06700.1 hypothetical protein GCM10011418_03540 [Sphingobacterium alkalisoli]